MRNNVGSGDRLARALAALGLLTCSVMAPLPLAVRAIVFGGLGGYLLLTALVGRCACYSLVGKSTCQLEPR